MRIENDIWRTGMEVSERIREQMGTVPALGVVLGSGWGAVFEAFLQTVGMRPYREIPGMPVSTVEGHAGAYVWGWAGDFPVLLMNGRIHYYEGFSMEEVTLPVRLMAAMGVQGLLLTNAAGGIRAGMKPGELMVISDHINLMGANPLIGPNDNRVGPRFPDMSVAWDADMRRILLEEGQLYPQGASAGVYLAVSGPNFETPAEIRAFRTLGADAVGMSTVPECIVARHAGLRVAGISCITNLAAGTEGAGALSHEDVQQTAARSGRHLGEYLSRVLPRLAAVLS